MRLNEKQVEQIKLIFSAFLKSQAKVFLVGSRTKGSLKGGDIDLLIVASEVELSSLRLNKLKIINELQKQSSIGDQKIDLIFSTEKDLQEDAFIKTLKESKIPL